VSHLDGVLVELAPRVLAFCWPYRAEPDLRSWVQAWLAADEQRVAALPVVVEKHAAMHFRRWTPGAEMVADRHGIPHPAEAVEVLPEAVLVPLNAFDAQGYRLGYGGGYFDRTLAQMETVAIGVGFELGRVPSALPQPHDRPMAWIVTEAGAVRAVR
jgi:5,10-methenyltetrahydrofolate synthetase